MYSRQHIIEIFSTFVLFKGDVFDRWITDSKLRRSMQNCLEQYSFQESETFWAIYWHRIWQTQASPIAVAHITAYLQEVCYWVARKMKMNVLSQHSIADFFQTAIARIDKVLRGFNPQLSSNLKIYAEFTFSNLIKDLLRQQQEVDICSDWGLLHKISQKRLVESLKQGGYPSQIIARYVLAWNCFLQVYAPNNAATAHKLTKPDNATLQAIAKLYNTERLSQPSSHPACTPENAESWLIATAKAVRFYEYPASVSLDVPVPGQETGELLDLLTNDVQESVLNEIILQEETEHLTQRTTEINRILSDALEKLDTAAQALLQTYYKQGLTQQDIALQLGVKQYTVSRQLTKIKKTLLMELAQWSQKTLHISVTSDVIDSMSNSLEEWLIAHYRPIILSSPVES
ncbi:MULTISPECIES: sigma-70 family RNA polymerase sigma factor [Nostoc]|uniref:Sigma-70 family RNA polymerase sigma factor n=1 Tax=Nostoc paludosum FACHB-159 TaxID=2692908 RepID=A0ABR8K5X1_9NOSO|nr:MULTISPECIES: sigma-70 family RNA polymerase sigma factor [Nostoc]MBD2677376.1 sigma-70 family RNA polymerase sigma factor [Nostoc sp. FACHB-857]MBD2734231.1 sigma-70 family RNA polymerase sigma factor [Nostoc paludosum FACHB-159]